MKKIVALVLSFVMIFSFAVPSFAITSDDQSNDLKSGWGSASSIPSYPTGYSQSWFYLMLYHTYQIRQTLNNIDTDTANIYSRLLLINDSVTDLLANSNFIKAGVSSIEDYSKLINSTLNSVKVNSDSILSNVENLVNYVDNVENLISTTNTRLSSILADTDMLQKVLADEDDLAFKNSQKDNQQTAQDSFFTPGNGSSIDSDKLGGLKSSTDSFFGSIDLSFYGSDFPLIHLGEGSEWLLLFTDESSLDMDPSFTPPPPTETPIPPVQPDPEPQPEVTPTPTISYSESTFTVSASGQGTVILYVDGAQVSNPYTFTQTYVVQSFIVTATAQEDGKEISSTASLDVSVPAKVKPKAPTPTLTYDESSLSVPASLSSTPDGVYIFLYVDGSQVDNPYTFTQTVEETSYTVTAYSSGSDYLKSDVATLTVTVPAYVPEPEPLVNLLPLATTEPGGSTVYNSTGYKQRQTIISDPFSPSSSSSYALTGWIPVSAGDTVYLYNFYPASGTLRIGYSSDISGTNKGVTSVQISKDSNGVFSYVVPSGYSFVRFSPSNNTGFTSSSVMTKNQYPVETTSFSLRDYNYSQMPVTSYYTARENLFFYLLKLFSLR